MTFTSSKEIERNCPKLEFPLCLHLTRHASSYLIGNRTAFELRVVIVHITLPNNPVPTLIFIRGLGKWTKFDETEILDVLVTEAVQATFPKDQFSIRIAVLRLCVAIKNGMDQAFITEDQVSKVVPGWSLSLAELSRLIGTCPDSMDHLDCTDSWASERNTYWKVMLRGLGRMRWISGVSRVALDAPRWTRRRTDIENSQSITAKLREEHSNAPREQPK
jgi:hypothetical protein